MLTCNNPSWIIYADRAVLTIAGFLLICVMQKVWHSKANKTDARWIRETRRGTFLATTAFSFITALTDLSPLAVLFLLTSSASILMIDAVALDRRRPPKRGAVKFTQASSVRGLVNYVLQLISAIPLR